MNRLTHWIDGLVERLCNWLNDSISGRRRLALLGNGMAGVDGGATLPVDRRLGADYFPLGQNSRAMQDPAHAKRGGLGTERDEDSCGFWAYCHMRGRPCVWCDGKNALARDNPYPNRFFSAGRDLCPTFFMGGKSKGSSAWYGCCKNPLGVAHLIAFLDCCGDHHTYCGAGFFRPFSHKCINWPAAKDWCDTVDYYCTVAIDMNQDGLCEGGGGLPSNVG
jgi:hypothetical protein